MSQPQGGGRRSADTGRSIDIGNEVEESGVGTSVDETPNLPETGDEDEPETDSHDQTSTGETDVATTSSTSDRSYIFIRRATSFSDFGALNSRGTIEARVARSRGRDSLLEDQPEEDDVHHIEQSDGRIKTESGFVMHFVDENALHLHGFDIVDTHQAYPVSSDTLETLPKQVLGRLREQNQLKITAEYDRDESAFRCVTAGWDREQTIIDELMEIADHTGGNLIGAAYYLAYRESKNWDRVDLISEIRDIEPRSVQQQINTIEEKLSDAESLGE